MGKFAYFSTLLLRTIPIVSCAPSSLQSRQETKWFSRYAALGDSFAAGPGAGEYDEGFPSGAWFCSRFNNAYPRQLQALMPNPDNSRQFAFDSCVSAHTTDVDSGQTLKIDPNTDLITLTVGGNDVGFADIINACIYRFAGPASGNCEDALKNSEDKIKNEFGGLIWNSIWALHRRVRDPKSTHLYITGYAKFFNNQTSQCNGASFSYWALPFFGDKMTNQRRTDLNNLVDLINTVIEDTVNRWRDPNSGENYWENVHFVNYDSEFDYHRFCEEGVEEPQRSVKPVESTWFYQMVGTRGTSSRRAISSTLQLNERDDEDEEPGSAVQQGEEAAKYLEWIRQAKENDPSLQVNPAYVDAIPELNIGNSTGKVRIPAQLPLTTLKIFHPTSDGHRAIAQAIWKAIQAKGPPGPPPPPPVLGNGLKCYALVSDTFKWQVVNNQCVRIWKEFEAGGDGWIGEFKPHVCDSTCYKWEDSFGGIEFFGDGTYGTDCWVYSDDNCQDEIYHGKNTLQWKKWNFKQNDQDHQVKGKSLRCYFKC